MKPSEYAINILLSIILIVGVYQFYFWCQRNHVAEPRGLKVPLDDRIPYWPRWVWVYSFLYYPVIVYVNFVMESPRQFVHVAVPEEWRVINRGRGRSERFLALVQRFDARSNSFPSMHTSVATLTALHLYPHAGPVIVLFPVLIALSCLFTKQHYLLDLPAGAALGGVAFWIYHVTYNSPF